MKGQGAAGDMESSKRLLLGVVLNPEERSKDPRKQPLSLSAGLTNLLIGYIGGFSVLVRPELSAEFY